MQYTTGNPSATIAEYAPDLPRKISMMNPMYFITQKWHGCARYWRIRTGSKDNHAAITMWTNLAISLENIGKTVNFAIYWEGGHGANYDPWNLIAWIGQITRYKPRAAQALVTGEGWIKSPKGAYTGAPDLEGKATFCFISKYHKGVLTGDTMFTFHAASFKFESISYEWLVVTDNTAQFKGTGTIAGRIGVYKFIVWAVDGDGKFGQDKFRIKIWEEVHGEENVIYDNGLNQPISHGKIVVHK